MKISTESKIISLGNQNINLKVKKYEDIGLNLEYVNLFRKNEADILFAYLEETVQYYSDEYSKVR